MTRSSAREIALLLIYEQDFHRHDFSISDERLMLLADQCGVPDAVSDQNREYIEASVRGVLERGHELDSYISRHAAGWNLGRISRMTKSMLRLCLHDILYGDVPAASAINEAVELAKKYDEQDETPGFVNGIMGAFMRAGGAASVTEDGVADTANSLTDADEDTDADSNADTAVVAADATNNEADADGITDASGDGV